MGFHTLGTQMRKIWAVTVGIALGTAFIPYLGSNFEYMVAPVFKDSVLSTPTLEEDGDLCWHWSFVKVRTARPLGFHYFARTPNLGAIPVIFHREDIPVNTIQRPLGPASDRYCARLPRGLAHSLSIEIFGTAFYTVPHGLWVLKQPLPTIRYSAR